jgi:hypothetical protein
MSVFSQIIDKIEADVKTEIQKIEGFNWASFSSSCSSFVKDLESYALPVISTLFPGTASTITKTVTPVLEDAKSAAAALASAVSAGEAASQSALVAAANAAHAAIANAVTTVATALKG